MQTSVNKQVRTLIPNGYMLSDTFTHSVVNFNTGKRIFVGQLSVCEDLVSTCSSLVAGRLRNPVRLGVE